MPEASGPAKVPYGAHRDRLDLVQALPLSTPLSLLIDPSNACNFRCTFCPTGDPDLLARVGRPRGVMTWELFAKLADDLAAFDRPIKSVHLYKDGEPLVNRHVPAMVTELKRRGLARTVEITSNGALLTPEVADALVAAGLDGIRVSVYAPDDDSYARVTGRAAFTTVRDNVAHLWRRKTEAGAPLHLHCKIIDLGFSAGQRQAFLDAFSPICDSVYVHPLHGTGLDAGGFRLVPDGGRKVCSEPFIKLVVNFNGQVSACCADWNWQAVVGDASRQSLKEIWEGEPLRRFRLTHLAGRRHDLDACRHCAYVTTLPADNNLDPVAQDLKARYAAPERVDNDFQ